MFKGFWAEWVQIAFSFTFRDFYSISWIEMCIFARLQGAYLKYLPGCMYAVYCIIYILTILSFLFIHLTRPISLTFLLLFCFLFSLFLLGGGPGGVVNPVILTRYPGPLCIGLNNEKCWKFHFPFQFSK